MAKQKRKQIEELLFQVYDKGLQQENCVLTDYYEKILQVLNIEFVSKSVKSKKCNFELDWRVGKYYISTNFEVVQYEGCGNGQHAMVGKGNNWEESVKILRERNNDRKFIEQREINGVIYFHYAY